MCTSLQSNLYNIFWGSGVRVGPEAVRIRRAAGCYFVSFEYIYDDTHIFMYIHAHIYIYIHIHIYIYMYTRIHIYIYIMYIHREREREILEIRD